MIGSVGEVASASDHAAMESLFAFLQKNVLDRQSLVTRDWLRIKDRDLDRTHLPPPPPDPTRTLDSIGYEMILARKDGNLTARQAPSDLPPRRPFGHCSR